MYLKLTAKNSDYKVLVNFDHVTSISNVPRDSDIREVKLINDNSIFVRETIEEIELMLMGSKSSAPDPRERNVIGQDTRRDNELSESDWNLRYNKP